MNYENYINTLPYPSTNEHVTTYFYYRGNVVGTAKNNTELVKLQTKFPDAVTEKVQDKENVKAMRDAYNAEEKRINQLFRKDLFAKNGLVENDFTSQLFSLAWSAGHSAGFEAIANHFNDYAYLDELARDTYGK